MTEDQKKAARSLGQALRKVRDANLSLRVCDGEVWVVPSGVDLWPDGDEGNVFTVLERHGQDVTPVGLHADGGAGV